MLAASGCGSTTTDPTPRERAEAQAGRRALARERARERALADERARQEEEAEALFPQEQEMLKRLADKYLRGVSTGDFRSACQTRTLEERGELERLAGSCPRAFASIERSGGDFRLFRRAKVGVAAIVLRDGIVHIPFFQPGQTEPADELLAKLEDDHYLLFEPDGLGAPAPDEGSRSAPAGDRDAGPDEPPAHA